MSHATALASPCAFAHRPLHDVDDSERIPSGWDLKILQTTPGSLEGESREVRFGGFQVMWETFRNVETNQYGAALPDCIGIGATTRMHAAGLFNGKPWHNGICVFDSRREIESIVPPMELMSMMVDRQSLCDYVMETEHVDLQKLLAKGSLVVNDADLAACYVSALREIFNEAIDPCVDRSSEVDAQHLQNHTLELIGPLVTRMLGASSAARHDRSHLQIVRRTREFAMREIQQPLRVIDLCREVGVPRRALQLSFQEVLGISPLSYLRTLRLNGARHRLANGHAELMIKDVAEEFGFWHLSRFSQDYRQMFGELPSETLRMATQGISIPMHLAA